MDNSTLLSSSAMKSHNLFQVYLRLRPAHAGPANADRFLAVESPAEDAESTAPTHITLNPPNDRRRAIERFGFTQVFEEDASQLDVFHCTKVARLVEGVLAPHGGHGTDALVATLGVTGSGKSHTILGSKSQRGMTQLALDLVFRSIADNSLVCTATNSLEASVNASDASEAAIFSASSFLEAVYGDVSASSRQGSRAPTPMIGDYSVGATPRKLLNHPSVPPQNPDISGVNVSCDPSAEYCVLVSMYEVYNDRIFDLLSPPIKSAATKELRRRPLLFKSTELSPDRKVVAGLRKIICGNLGQALMVLEAGLHERRVAGTGSNSVSSRSHGFFCVEVKKRSMTQGRRYELPWGGSTLTIVDLAGSERARDAKTAGATLAEAGKINESLMYLGQCLQMQSDSGSTNKPNLVPYRQCKLTELLFSNSFPSPSVSQSQHSRRNPQKAVMIVTADPHGDFNATSQILRYSALAREITVPRIPSITQTILNTAVATQAAGSGREQPIVSSSPVNPSAVPHHSRPPFVPPGAGTSSATDGHRTFSPMSTASGSTLDEHRATMELAALEIARLAEEGEYLRTALQREQDARAVAEAHCVSFEERLLDLEQAIREDCAAEFESRLALEMARWKAGLQLEQERGEEHWDRKIEIFTQGVGISRNDHDHDQDLDTQRTGTHAAADGRMMPMHQHEDENKENVLVEDLEQENDRLRREIGVLKRELAGRSPTKRRPLGERDDVLVSSAAPSPTGSAASSPRGSLRGGESLQRKMERLRVTDRDGADVSPIASASVSAAEAAARRDASSASAYSGGSPTKKARKLPPRKWDAQVLDDDGPDLF